MPLDVLGCTPAPPMGTCNVQREGGRLLQLIIFNNELKRKSSTRVDSVLAFRTHHSSLLPIE